MLGRCKITLNDIEFELRFNNYCNSELEKIFVKDGVSNIEEEYNNNSAFTAMRIIYCGIVGYYHSILEIMPFNMKQIAEWFADANTNDIANAISVFIESKKVKDVYPNKEMTKQPTKKKR